eukprot:scaffold77759_cov76-Phaeocystis_antarctica.AAC.1
MKPMGALRAARRGSAVSLYWVHELVYMYLWGFWCRGLRRGVSGGANNANRLGQERFPKLLGRLILQRSVEQQHARVRSPAREVGCRRTAAIEAQRGVLCQRLEEDVPVERVVGQAGRECEAGGHRRVRVRVLRCNARVGEVLADTLSQSRNKEAQGASPVERTLATSTQRTLTSGVASNVVALMHASAELRSDREIVLAAVRECNYLEVRWVLSCARGSGDH